MRVVMSSYEVLAVRKVPREKRRWDDNTVFYLGMSHFVRFRQPRSQERGSNQILFRGRQTMTLSHCVVAAIRQAAPLLSLDILFLEEWGYANEQQVKEGSGLPGLVYYCLLHSSWCLPLYSDPPKKLSQQLQSRFPKSCLSWFPFLFCGSSSQVSTPVTCLCWGRDSFAELSCSCFCSWAREAVGLSVLHEGKQHSRRLPAEALGLKNRRFVCSSHCVWNPQGSNRNSSSPPVSTNILPGAWLKIIHMPVFRPRPKCLKIIYVPITLHYFLTKDLISLQWRTQYNLANFKAATENLHLGAIFPERHSVPFRIFPNLWDTMLWWNSEIKYGVATKGGF